MTLATAVLNSSHAASALRLRLPLVIAHLVGLEFGGPWVWLSAGYVFVLIPLLDLVPIPPPDDERAVDAEPFPEPTSSSTLAPIQATVLAWTLWRVTTASPAGSVVGLVVSAGIVSGAGITIAHELMHRARPSPRLAEGLMACALCPLHHRARPRPPQARGDAQRPHGRRGEWIYAFLVRVVATSAVQRAARGTPREEPGHLVDLKDRRVRFALVQAGLVAAVALAFGSAGLGFFLARPRSPCCSSNSWTTSSTTDWSGASSRPGRRSGSSPIIPGTARTESARRLFQLTRHSDHHANASRPYYRSGLSRRGPRLPGGYPAMMLLSLAPPLFFRVVDPLSTTSRRGQRRLDRRGYAGRLNW